MAFNFCKVVTSSQVTSRAKLTGSQVTSNTKLTGSKVTSNKVTGTAGKIIAADYVPECMRLLELIQASLFPLL